jgi:2-polyprenyl-3-methyl-5-hydroxy-6-metoxy-1,4-benzoquinol methylase
VNSKREISCPLCDEKSSLVLFKPTQMVDDPQKLYGAASGIPGTQTIVKCKSCEMIYESPRFDDAVILQGYTQSNEAGHDSQYPMRVESFYRTLKSLKKHIPAAGSKILDIGTAGGAFLEAAQQFGYDAWGMEPSQYLVKQGKARGLKIEAGTIDSHPFAPQSFDMVCLWDVIEHLTQPREALVKIKSLLKPGGILLINYPDIGTWQAKITGAKFWWIISVHLQHFTRSTIKAICQKTGYQVFHLQPYWQTLQFGYLEDMAAHYKIPLTALIAKLTPKFIRKIPLPYYASQTTALAKISS